MKIYSPEERAAYNEKKQAEAEARIKSLAENWQENPEDIAEYLRFRQQFHQYSLSNSMLIYVQNPAATFVGSFSFFRDKGYMIRRGEHGMSILAPNIREFYRTSPTSAWRPLNKDTPPEDRRLAHAGAYEITSKVTGYRVTTVFDITQTNCPLEDYPKLLGVGYNSTQHAAIYQAVCQQCAQLGMPVSESALQISLRGMYYPGTNHIVINQSLGDTQKLSTLFHEMGHGILGHSSAPISEAQQEFEADAFSILMENRYGVEVTEARKRHLADHYRTFVQELRESGQEPDITKMMANVNQRYLKLVEQVEPAVLAATQGPTPTVDTSAPPQTDPRAVKDLLKMRARMPKLSLRNLLRVQLKCPRATKLATAEQFAAHGLTVRPGEKPVPLIRTTLCTEIQTSAGWVPMETASPADRQAAQIGTCATRIIKQEAVVSLYDIRQTDCPESQLKEYAEGPRPIAATVLTQRIMKYAAAYDIPLIHRELGSPELIGGYDLNEKALIVNAHPNASAETLAQGLMLGYATAVVSRSDPALSPDLQRTIGEAAGMTALMRAGIRTDELPIEAVQSLFRLPPDQRDQLLQKLDNCIDLLREQITDVSDRVIAPGMDRDPEHPVHPDIRR